MFKYEEKYGEHTDFLEALNDPKYLRSVVEATDLVLNAFDKAISSDPVNRPSDVDTSTVRIIEDLIKNIYDTLYEGMRVAGGGQDVLFDDPVGDFLFGFERKINDLTYNYTKYNDALEDIDEYYIYGTWKIFLRGVKNIYDSLMNTRKWKAEKIIKLESDIENKQLQKNNSESNPRKAKNVKQKKHKSEQ